MKTHNKNQQAFTIVELVVVIVIIGILSMIVTLTGSKIQKDQRDSQRANKASVVASALEKYYDKTGEYPSPVNLSGNISANSGSLISDKFSLPAKALVMPGAPKATTNSILNTDIPSTDVLAYQAKKHTRPNPVPDFKWRLWQVHP